MKKSNKTTKAPLSDVWNCYVLSEWWEKSDASLNKMFFGPSKLLYPFFPGDNPMDWIYEKTLEYPMLWIYLCYVYYITYTYIYIYSIFIFKSRHALDFHPSSGVDSFDLQEKAMRTRSKSFFGYPKIQIHKKWDTKTRCKPGTLSNQFKMDALCNNRFSCEDSKSI